MDGRVERRINNKFYFVLDEVGPSDCDSEQGSDNENKFRKDFNMKDKLDSSATPITIASDNSNSEETLCENNNKSDSDAVELFANISQSSCTSREDNERDKFKSVKSEIQRIKHQHNNESNLNLDLEESSAVVDMDVDSEEEIVELSTKPLIKITFRDEDVKKHLKSSLLEFFSEKIKNCAVITNSDNELEFEIYDKNLPKLVDEGLIDFDLDTTPGENQNVPYYGQSYNHILSDQNEKNTPPKLSAISMSCFNCLGNHTLRDCTKPIVPSKVYKNRLKKFQNTPKNSRYHLDDNQRFGHLIPGVISKKLRNALNLHRNQQPEFIYRMRVLGYPPAWLEEAKVSHSGVVVYDKIGAPVLEDDEEEGEIIPEGAKDKFDVTKIIEFPGFNAPLPKFFKDEGKYYSCPALSQDQSKENLIKTLAPKTVKAYVKKSLKQNSDENDSQNDEKRLTSPTIEEMEERKRILLMELNGEDSDSKQVSEESNNESSAAKTESSNQSAQNKELGSVKKLELGTPILKSVSSFSKLPSREQFSVNVSDVINFENLPNSTGKYESMRQVISKIRVSVSKTHSG